MINRWSLFMCVVVFTTILHAQTNYKNIALELYGSIQKNFYIQDSGYYREEAIGKPTEKPVS
ncbi:MAG: hypothetical protein DI598_00900 [Pseudopedobacter saltans]|uniref:Uncharacterized protein n=1 Tax=Pseudopedobacter saltans TaxID=151895 RepID=A0A2W5HFA1_9SPHI|nr:MAG: hypothetical protein DI598_00900 [Pseudopedobacter saltans]